MRIGNGRVRDENNLTGRRFLNNSMDKMDALAKYPDIRALLDEILSRQREILGEKLAGLYVYGSLVAGDFDSEISDIDLLAATAKLIDADEFAALERMHLELMRDNPKWDNRIEIQYAPLVYLENFKTQKAQIANISPGEPFHFIEAGRDWLLNWYFVREHGVKLFGAPSASVIAPISKAEFIESVREQAFERAENVESAKHSRPYQAYLIMTVCRALYAVEKGEQVSKRRAATWAQEQFPEDAALIENAFAWREKHRDKNINHEATFPEARRFIIKVVDRIR
jgi:predicted nucleotidyltransferase